MIHAKYALKQVSTYSSVIVIFLGILSLIGWFLNIPQLRRILPDVIEMKPAAALAFIFTGLSLWFLIKYDLKIAHNYLWNLCTYFVLMISITSILQYLFKMRFGIELLFIKNQLFSYESFDALRISPASAVNFLLISLSLLLYSHNAIRLSRFIFMLIVPIAVFAFLNFLIESHSLIYPQAFTPISFLSSFSFIMISVSYFSFTAIRNLTITEHLPDRFRFKWQPYSVAIISIALAAALRVWPLQSLGMKTVWVTFYPAVMFIALYGGQGPGLFATLLSSLTALFLWPLFVDHPFIKDFGDWVSMTIFITTCSIISVISELLYRTKEKLKYSNQQLMAVNIEFEKEIENRQNAEKELDLLNKELEHRVESRTEELEEANQVLRIREERFRSTLDNMLEGCQIIGFDWRYIYINDTADIHNRRSKNELLGNKYMDMWPGIEETHVFAVIKKTLEERIAHQLENEFTYPDGTKGWFELSIQPVPEGVFILSIDITARKNSEEAIHKLNQELEQRIADRTAELKILNKELEAFTYSVSHDLRAPLRHINGFVELLQKGASKVLDEKHIRYLNIITDSVKQMGSLIEDLLNFSRLGKASLNYRLFNLHDLVQQVIDENKNTSINPNIDWHVSELPSVFADHNLLKIVLANLLNNAVKYSAKVNTPKIQIGSYETNESKIVFYVKDNGAGFDMKYAHKLFGVFQRLHSSSEYEGTGIGLATVRRIIHKHNGETWAEGEVGKGASFYFSLPIPHPAEKQNLLSPEFS